MNPWLYDGFSVQYVRTLLDLGEKKGVSREKLMHSSGISEGCLKKKAGIIPCHQVINLFNSIISITRDNSLGFHLAQNIRPGSFGALGYTLMNCKNLREVLTLTREYCYLVSNVGAMSFEEKEGVVRVCWYTTDFSAEQMRPAHEAIIAGWFLYSKWLIGKDARLIEVWFRHSPAPSLAEYHEVFNCPVIFNRSCNALVFPATYLDLPIHNSDPDIFEEMLTRTRYLAERQRASMDIRAQVSYMIYRWLPQQKVSLQNIAKALHLSERGLRRKLQEKGCTYQQLLDGIRKDIALRGLQDMSRPILDIAYSLGYRHPSAFSGAFKGWYGISPVEYRRNHSIRLLGISGNLD